MEKILEIKELKLGFNCAKGYYEALHGITFCLSRGEMHALVGESGSGKTISAMSILRLLPKNAVVTGGEIIYNGEDLLKLSESAIRDIRGSKIALIPQDPMTSLNPLYTIGNQIEEVIKIHQKLEGKEAYKKAIDALEMVQIPNAKERMNSYPHEFSGGMKQRAIIAMALACNAEIIIADEPTTALDVTIQAQIMKLLKEIQKESNTSIILITHDLGLVRENAETLSVMYAGEIVESGKTEEILSTPEHPYTKGLLNSLPRLSVTRLKTLNGTPPNIQEEITGCKFHPRCEEVLEICKTQSPKLIGIKANHSCSCHLIKKGLDF